MAHATFSPSGAPKWMTCPGSAAMEAGLPNPSSKYADEGTAAHFLASEWLNDNGKARDYLDRSILIYEDDTVSWQGPVYMEKVLDTRKVRSNWTVTEEMLGYIQKYVDNINAYVSGGSEPIGLAYVEVKLPLVQVTGEADAYGTADVVVLRGNELQVHDLKYGRGVEVEAEDNYQLIIYALAAMAKYGGGEINTVRMVIHQPRKHHFPECCMSFHEVMEAADRIHDAALDGNDIIDDVAGDKAKVPEDQLVPGSHCRNNFCRARSICPALTGKVLETVSLGDFEDLTTKKSEPSLSQKMKMIPIIEDWCKAVRAQCEAKLFSGEDVEGWKLVTGKKGNRKWDDTESIEKDMLAMRITHKYIYDYKLASPTTLEKHVKNNHVNSVQWKKIKKHITQSEGVPSVAPSSDKRPALSVNPKDDFDDVGVTDSLKGLI